MKEGGGERDRGLDCGLTPPAGGESADDSETLRRRTKGEK